MNSKLKMIVSAMTSAAITFSPYASAQISGDTVKIGFITDLSGLYADIDGNGGVEAIKMAIADFGGKVNSKKIELLTADHQNKPDIAASKTREWIDQEGVDLIIAGTNSAAALAMNKIAADKKKPIIVVSAGTSRVTNEECTPYTVHYSYDTIALSKVAGSAIVKQGGDSWYFLTADYAFGAALEKDASEVVKASGGKVLGSVKAPLNTSDFSSYMLQAQTSKAKILGLANSGGDTINSIKSANEFGITKSMQLAGLLMFITDIHSLGLQVSQGMYLADAWYWDTNPDTRAWAKRYFEKMKKEPSSTQAADYSATMTFLKAVQAAGTDNGEKVMAQIKSAKINDMFAKNGYIRQDGRMVHDMYLMQVKKPSESKYPWDYYNIISVVPGDQAFATKAESKCPLWK
ncbi:ABC transporter substrate-binding protein [Polynucleobacter paneuropaeus]|jgi:branched-chain amino acid transport system substrate-binding protein|nr:ABC transporter substrate-binding protein [Polynucleobacter paneuropaeus]MBT8616241.1 ABC transporter substrate-binding protein [Polynucleobacter paneuropaeus]MBT8618122.1 ABC transporter substrate-binding protein [Polynucleobacter paneuropaeus]MBT8620403.1 ABC transporter substrate-binding protein [Polynucleobacter paneuropaeus]MBT8625538.1 ABC transporter substrate-binding protein [Polynucleobacter paneuropaeus]